MQHLATALATAIVHIAYRATSSEDEEDKDVQTLEDLAALLRSAPASELGELQSASRRLAAESQDQTTREQFEQLMEHLGLAPEELE
jgi:hypothetical protein